MGDSLTTEQVATELKKLSKETMAEIEVAIHQATYNHSGSESIAFLQRELSFKGLGKYLPIKTTEEMQFTALMLQILKYYKFLDSYGNGEGQKEGNYPESENGKEMYR